MSALQQMPRLRNVARKIRNILRAPAERAMRRKLDAIPRKKLQAQHLEGANLALNRRTMLRDHLPKGGTVAELGVDSGTFSSMILAECQPEKLHLVDIWGDTRYGQDKADLVAAKFTNEIASEKVQIHRLLSLQAADHFPDGHFDWVYIDTDHSYATTIAELRAWAPKIKPGGMLAGHDYVMGNFATAYKYGVIEAVAEFCVDDGWAIHCLTADHTESNSFALRRLS